jgi:transposase
LLELIPGGAKKDLSAAQSKALLAKVRRRDAAGKTRRRVAAELIGDLERIYKRKGAADKELVDLVEATGTSLLALKGIGPSGAPRLLAEVGDITRSRTKTTSRPGTAPPGSTPLPDHVRHRLSRAGNRQINRELHIMATGQLGEPHRGTGVLRPEEGGGQDVHESMRCLKRRLSDIVYRHMINDGIANAVTGPGGQRGNDSDSSATGSHPHAGSSDKPLPGPATAQPTTPLQTAS